MNKYQLLIRLIGVISVIVSEAVQMQIILQTKLILQCHRISRRSVVELQISLDMKCLVRKDC